MAKILITLVGTGKKAKGDEEKNEYEGTDYLVENKLYDNKKFVSSAIIEHYNIDKTFIIGTDKSMWDNIADYFDADEEYIFELLDKKEKRIEQSDLNKLDNYIDKHLDFKGSKCFVVEDGENEEELWSIFDKFIEILNQINENDEVYVDITHLFRSLSVMSVVMLEFGQIYKDFQIKGVFYGALNKNGPSKVINLSMFFELLEWARALDNLKRYGNGFDLLKLLEQSNQQKEIINSFGDFSYALGMSDIGKLQNAIKILKGKMDIFENHNSNIIKIISHNLKDFINKFHKIDDLAKFQLELAWWYRENKNYSMAYMTLVEASISLMCQKNNLDSTDYDDREKAKKIFWEWGDYRNATKEQQKIAKTYKKVNAIRINIAHKTSSKNSASQSSPKNSIENFDDYYKILKNI